MSEWHTPVKKGRRRLCKCCGTEWPCDTAKDAAFVYLGIWGDA